MAEMQPIALQLYSLREQLGQEFESAVRRVAAMGYIGVEPYGGMPAPLADAAALFRELDLQVCNSHVPFPDDANKEAVLEIAAAFELQDIAIAFMPPENFESIDAVKRTCQRLNDAGQFASANGLKLHYHNHWWEFKIIDGESTVDLMLEELDESVGLQIDTYWAQVGGLDAVDVVKRAGARAPLIHLKDGWLEQAGDMAHVGGGLMDVPAIVEETRETAHWYIVEQDRSSIEMFDSVEASYAYLTTNGLARGKG